MVSVSDIFRPAVDLTLVLKIMFQNKYEDQNFFP